MFWCPVRHRFCALPKTTACFRLRPAENQLTVEIGLQHLRAFDLILRALEKVGVQHNEIGKLAWFQRADLIFEKQEVTVVPCVKTDGLLPAQRFFGMEPAVIPSGLARDRGPHREEGVVGIDRPERTYLLPVVRAAARNPARLEYAPQRLKIP